MASDADLLGVQLWQVLECGWQLLSNVLIHPAGVYDVCIGVNAGAAIEGLVLAARNQASPAGKGMALAAAIHGESNTSRKGTSRRAAEGLFPG